MAGFYVHIPFCRKVCYYCDFHFVASLKNKDLLLKSMCNEIQLRSNEWNKEEFDTIYVGGGTPTVLNIKELSFIIETIYSKYTIRNENEFTIEANPDDLSAEYLKDLLKKTPVNRLSIGVQSFQNKDLELINRRHNSNQAINCIEAAKNEGFNNITIDLIYGIPGMTLDDWKRNLDQFLALEIPHLSAYHLSIEPKTVFGVWQKKNKISPINEDLSQQQYQYLIDTLSKAGYEHYEIANFALKGFQSIHNTSYWRNVPYLGIGPSAHSYNGKKRRWNLSNNDLYTKFLEQGSINYFEEETLSLNDKFNDYILTSLRTSWGIDLETIKIQFGEIYLNHVIKISEKYLPNKLSISDNTIRITEIGWLVSDSILSDFIFA